MTSFLVDDFLADRSDFDARTFVVSSASSKTAIALASLLSKRGAGTVVGLTSARNRTFVESLGCYDRVVLYHAIDSLESESAAVFIEHAGDGAVVNAVHERFGERLVYSCIVGATHWDAAPRAKTLPGAPPTFFFAPAQLEKRTKEWGAAGFQQRLGAAWEQFRARSERWFHVVRGNGPAAVERVYDEVLAGRTAPSDGHVLSLWDRTSTRSRRAAPCSRAAMRATPPAAANDSGKLLATPLARAQRGPPRWDDTELKEIQREAGRGDLVRQRCGARAGYGATAISENETRAGCARPSIEKVSASPVSTASAL